VKKAVRIDIFTLFPETFEGTLKTSILGRAISQGLVRVNVHNLRDFTHDKHHTADDYPYGGGAGMVLKPEPVFEAVETLKRELTEEKGMSQREAAKIPVILLTPQGRLFSQAVARELSKQKNLMLICGHYEGVDERVCQHLATDEISIGDYVLTGGELAAMVVVDATIRLLPGVLGSELSPEEDSHSNGLLEYPQYTRPAVFRGWAVPEVLLSGNHEQIARWRREQSILRTFKRRPELLEKLKLEPKEKELIQTPES